MVQSEILKQQKDLQTSSHQPSQTSSIKEESKAVSATEEKFVKRRRKRQGKKVKSLNESIKTTRSSQRRHSNLVPAYLAELNSNLIDNRAQFDQLFSYNSLFHSSNSLLTKLDLKALFHTHLFESLPRQSQLKLIKLLPECDRTLDAYGSFRLSIGALNNEFIKKCCTEWQHKLVSGKFDINSNASFNCNATTTLASENYDNNILNTSAAITRSTRLRQQKLLESLK